MSTIEEKVEEAWFDYEYQAHGNLYSTCFKDGYMQGAAEALRSQWVSVEDELPENEQYVLVCYKDTYGFGFGVAGYFDNEWYTADDNLKIDKIVAWMPIPPLPEARKEGEV